jgi:hypothetical protein
MIRQEVSTAGFTLTKEVPGSVEEYNSLAPKRVNAVLEDAVANTLYRAVFAGFRADLADAIATDSGIARKTKKVGEKEVFDESEGKYLARVQAELGLDDDAFAAKYQSTAQSIMNSIAFDPSVRESTASTGPRIGKNDLKLANELIARGADTVARVAGLLGAVLNRTVATDEKSLASAFADKRRADAARQAEADKATFGL